MRFRAGNGPLRGMWGMAWAVWLWTGWFPVHAQQRQDVSTGSAAHSARGAGTADSKKSVPAPVRDSLGHIAIYPPAEVAERDQIGQLADFSSRAELLNKVVRIRDRVWTRLGLRRVRPPESVQIQILRRLDTSEDVPEVFEVDTGYARVIRMRVAESENGDSEVFTRAVLVALVRDLMARSSVQEEPNRAQRPVPRWLVDALLHCEKYPEVIQFSDALNSLPEKELFSLSLKDLLARPEDDARESAGAEILAARCFLSLLGSEGGRSEAFPGWLRVDPVSVPVAALGQFFPWLPKTAVEIQKAWIVHGAALRAQRTRVSMTALETEKSLERLLEMDVVLPGNVRQVTSLDNFEEFIRIPGIEFVLRARRLELIAFASRAHFMFEPLIRVYAELCGNLAERRTKNLSERFRSARAEWELVRARLERIRDYLDWWEALPEGAERSEQPKEMSRVKDAVDARRPELSSVSGDSEDRLKERDRQEDLRRIVEDGRLRPRSKEGR